MWEGTLRRDIFDIYVIAYSVVIFVGACLVFFRLFWFGFVFLRMSVDILILRGRFKRIASIKGNLIMSESIVRLR